MKRVLITGAAGFIGFHLALALQKRGDFVIGLDQFNAYYNVALKKDRANILEKAGIQILQADICDQHLLQLALLKNNITHVVHLAAQAGVRHSLKAPNDYVSSNLQGFVSLLEACKQFPQLKITYASSSSVYGLNTKIPFEETDETDLPANLYGATKKGNEMMARAYHHLYGMKLTGLRFFTVYGPWGRPDMAYYHFTDLISRGEPIQVFHEGRMQRDFTYIDDIIEGTIAAIDLGADFEIFNLGNNRPEELMELIRLIEKYTNQKAIQQLLPMQPGEVITTYANIDKAKAKLGFQPKTSLEEGMKAFIAWYKDYSLAKAL
jgi:UDP-glucuronate 4-epimerase